MNNYMKKEDTLLLVELFTFYYCVYMLSRLRCLLCTTPSHRTTTLRGHANLWVGTPCRMLPP